MGNPENFTCEACGKSYRWKPEFAGRRIKCKCGSVMTVPAPTPEPDTEPAADDEPDFDALYSLAAEGKQAEKAGATVVGVRCPSCRAQLEAGAAACPQCGFNLRTGKKSPPLKAGAIPAGGGAAVATAGQPPGGAFGFPGAKRGLQQVDTEFNPVMELYVPLAVLAFGIFGVFAQYMWFGDVVHNFAGAVPWAICEIIVSCVLLAGVCLFAINMMDVAFGSPGPAAIKIAAIALGPTAIWGFVAYMIGGTIGYWAGRIVALMIFYTLFHLFFEFDTGEAIRVGSLFYLTQVFLARILVVVLMGMLIVSGGTGLGPDQAARNDDNFVLEAIDNRPTDDAMKWLDESGNRMFAHTSHPATVQLIRDLISFGCSKSGVIVIKGDGDASDMWIKLPSNKEKRTQAFACYNTFATTYNVPHKKDTGQTYLLMTSQ